MVLKRDWGCIRNPLWVKLKGNVVKSRKRIGRKGVSQLNNSGTRYWLSFDLGLQGDYESLYGWLDKQKAKECGGNVATFVSKKTRDQIMRELSSVLDPGKNPRIYIISTKQGGKFILGKRTLAAWTGYAQVSLESGEER